MISDDAGVVRMRVTHISVGVVEEMAKRSELNCCHDGEIET